MMNVDAIDYPVMWILTPKFDKRLVGAGKTLYDLCEMPLHDYLKGHVKKQIFVSATGKVMRPENVRLRGISWRRFQVVGWVTEFIIVILSLFNVPVLVKFDLTETGEKMSVDDVRKELKQALKDYPKSYFRWRSEQTVRKKINRAQSIAELADAIA